jgi:hypothetical protein
MTGMRNAYRILIGKFEGRRPLGKPRYRWKDSIKMHFESRFGGYGLDLSGSGWGSVVGSFEHCNASSDSIEGGEFLEWLIVLLAS